MAALIIHKSKHRTTCKTVRGGQGYDYSIQVECIPLKPKKIKKSGAYKPSMVVARGKHVKISRYYFQQKWTYKIRGRYSLQFLRNYGAGSKNRNWGQISCEEHEYEGYVKAMANAIVRDVLKMKCNNDGNVIRRDKAYIQQKY